MATTRVSKGKGKGGADTFPAVTCAFMEQLAHNNNGEWFAENKSAYQAQVVKPLKDFIEGLQPVLGGLDARLDVAYKVNTTVLRINRDRRFNPDAPPYRGYVKVSFPHVGRKWSNDPVLGFGVFPEYFHVSFRNAGKARAEFVERFNKNMQDNQPLVQRWLDEFKISKELHLLEGEHNDVETGPACPRRAGDWLAYREPTVGYIWAKESIAAGRCTFAAMSGKLVRLYFLKLLAVSRHPARDAESYFKRAAALVP